jgi:glycosyltransferase involved in cell wall biosynthesis
MRIGFLATEFVTEPNLVGGYSNYLYRISRLLVMRGHEVHVVTITHSHKNESFMHEGIFVHRVAPGRLYRRLNLFFKYMVPLTSLWLNFSFRAFLRLRQLHTTSPFDALQFPTIHACGIFSSLFLRIPYVVRISSYAPLWNEFRGRKGIFDYRLLELLERIQLRIAPYIYAPSVRMKILLQKELEKNNIHLIPTPFFVETNGFDDSIYNAHIAKKPYVLFFSGRLERLKGPQVLAQALPVIFSRHPDLMAVFVGRDFYEAGQSMRLQIQSLCKDYKERLLFFDPMPHSQLYPLIQHAEVVVLPSLIDNMPNACLEAMGLGAVVIGTVGSSLDEIIIDGKNGFLVKAEDAEHLESVLLQVLKIRDKQSIAQAALETIKRFSPEKVIPQIEAYYVKAIDKL